MCGEVERFQILTNYGTIGKFTILFIFLVLKKVALGSLVDVFDADPDSQHWKKSIIIYSRYTQK